MKAKKLKKRMQLGKQTISDLKMKELASIYGGRQNTSLYDPKYCYTECYTGVCCIY